MTKARRFWIVLALFGFVAATAGRAEAGLLHDYEFNGNLNDGFGGPALVSLGGTLNPAYYSFLQNQGLSLTNGLSAGTIGNYTIDLSFRFDDTMGYKKIIDFAAKTADAGLYTLNGQLGFYPTSSFPPAVTVTPGQLVRVDLTRDGTTQLVSGYVNGALQFSFTDSGGAAVFSAAGNVVNLFVDDTTTFSREAAPGLVNQIRFFDTALSAADILALGGPKPLTSGGGTDPGPNPVPEPATVFMGATAGLLGLGYNWRRKRAAA